MKTDLIEIFQTIRASLQPYAALGFDNRTNSETVYDLWSNKNVEIDGEARHEVFFASVTIEKKSVTVHLFPDDLQAEFDQVEDANISKLLKAVAGLKVTELDDLLLTQIEDAMAAAYKLYKEEGWV